MRHTFSLILATGIVSGCAGPQKVAGPSPEFAPVIPVATQQSSIPTGSVYNVAFSDSWFADNIFTTVPINYPSGNVEYASCISNN